MLKSNVSMSEKVISTSNILLRLFPPLEYTDCIQ